MATILLVAAEAREFSGLVRRFGGERLSWPLKFARAVRRGEDRLLMTANGAGPRLAAEAVRIAARHERPDVVGSVGYCGALDTILRVGDIVVGDRVLAPESEEQFEVKIPVANRRHICGTIVSIDRFVQTAGEKRRLRVSGGVAVEMEAAGIARETRGFGLPLVCIRVVTDEAEEGFNVDYNAARDAQGRFRPTRLVFAAMARPWRSFPELLRFRRRCQLASTALGDFIGDSEFQF